MESAGPVAASGCGVPLADVIATAELTERPSKAPNHADENAALLELAHALAEQPASVLSKLVDVAMRLTNAHSSGISILESGEGRPEEQFRWQATSGGFASYVGGTLPRHFSPCGTVLDRRTALLMKRPDQHFQYISELRQTCVELLLVPFGRGSELIGTLWVVSHDPAKQFDAEDLRVLSNLARFASMAFKSLADLKSLEETSSRLAVTHGRLESALDAGAIGTWTWDIGNDRVYADANLLAVFGLPADTPSGLPLSRYTDSIHPSDRDDTGRLIQQAIEQQSAYEASYRVVHGDGEIRWVDARGKVTVNAEGSTVDLSGIVMDVTARKKLEQAEREVAQRQNIFLATLGHELRNPLAPIRNTVELLRHAKLTAPLENARLIMGRQVTYMTRLIDDLLDTSRIANDKIHLKLEQVDLRDAVIGGVDLTQPAISAASQILDVDLPQEAVWVHGDAVRLTQIFGNLLGNATKFTPRGGSVRIGIETTGKTAYVRVTDSGCGIAAARLGSIFQMFVQGEPGEAQRHGGLGIGLGLSKTLVELHQGRLHAESAGEGHGSTFVCELPLILDGSNN